MAVGTVFLTGFEHGFVGTAAAAGGGLLGATAVTGTGWSASATSPRNGSYCAHLVAPANTANWFTVGPAALAQAKIVERFGVKVSSRPSSGDSVIATGTITGGVLPAYKLTVSSTGVLKLIAGTTVTGPTIDTTNWHLIEFQIDTSANPWTIDWKVDGVLQTRATNALAATTVASVALGNASQSSTVGTQAGFTADYDDVIIGTWANATDWYGDGKVLAQVAGSDGTHATITSLSPGDAGTAYAGTPTTVYTMVDDAPGTGGWTATRDAVDNIALRVPTVAAYAEIKPAVTAESFVANAVRAIASYSAPSTAGNIAACDVRNSAGVVTALRGTTGGVGAAYSVTANNFAGGIVTQPSAGWSASEVNAVRFRFGGCTSVDVSPIPTIQAMMLEVDWPVFPVASSSPVNETSIDDFNRADGPIYAGTGANIWESVGKVDNNTTATVVVTASNQMGASSAPGYVRSKVQLQSDFDFLIDVVSGAVSSTLSFFFALTDIGTAGYDGYALAINGNLWTLSYYTNGSPTTLSSIGVGPSVISGGGTFWITKRGTITTVYYRASVGDSYRQFLTVDDARNNVASPFTVTVPNTGWRLDNLRGGPLVSTDIIYNDAGSGIIAASGVGVENYSHDASVSNAITASGSGVENYQIVYDDSGLGTVTASGSGIENYSHDAISSGTITASGSGVDYVSSTVYEEVLDQDAPVSHWRLGTDTLAYDRRRLLDLPAVSGPISTSSALVAGSDLGSTFTGTQRFGLTSAANRGLPYQTANWTVEAWVKPTTLASTQYAVYRPNLILQMSGSTLRADLLDGASSSKIVILKSNAVIGVTYHAVVTYDGINLIGYLNGVEVARTPMTGTASELNDAPTIGSRSDGVVPFTGTIDEVSWYNTALSAQRVLAHFQAGSFGDKGSGIISMSGTAVESSSYVDAGTVTGVNTGSGTESYSAVDSSSGTITASGTGVESYIDNDSRSGTVTASGTGTESYSAVDSSSGTITASGSGIESYQATYIDISSGTVTTSGIGTESYSYADSGSGTVTASGTGTESYVYTDSRSGTVTASGSGTESYIAVDNSSGTGTVSGNRVEQASYADISSGTVTASGIVTESYSYADSGSGTVTANGTGTESYSYTDSRSGTVTASGSGIESYQIAYVDSGSGTVTASGSGTENYQVVYVDSGSGTITASGSGLESYQVASAYTDSGSGTITASGSGVESYQPTYADIATGTVAASGVGTESYSNVDSGSGTIVASGTRAESSSYTDISSGTINASGTGSDNRIYPDTSTGTIVTTGTGSDDRAYTDISTGTIAANGTSAETVSYSASAVGTCVVAGTGIDSQVYNDALSGTALISGTGVESSDILIGYIDARSGQVNANGSSVESQSHSSTATGSALVNGTSVESQSRLSTATGALSAGGTSVESQSHASTATGSVFVDGTGSETYNVSTVYTDTSAGVVTSTGTGVDSVSYSNAATGTVTSTGTSIDSVFYSNTAVGTITLLGSGDESLSYIDISTGVVVVTGIGRERGTYTQPVPISTVIALNRFNVAVWNKMSIHSVITSTAPLSVQIAIQRTIKVDVTKRNGTKVLVNRKP